MECKECKVNIWRNIDMIKQMSNEKLQAVWDSLGHDIEKYNAWLQEPYSDDVEVRS